MAGSSSSTTSGTTAPSTSTSTVRKSKSANRQPGCCIRFSFYPVMLAALALLALAVYSTMWHTYIHPMNLVAKYLNKPELVTPVYETRQPCEVSTFHLSHKLVPITQLTPLSQALVDGKVRFDPSLGQSKSGTPSRRRADGEFSDEPEIAKAEQAEIEASKKTLGLTQVQEQRQTEFTNYATLFLSSLPGNLVPGASARYKLMQYFYHVVHHLERDPSVRAVPVLFLHGNAGMYHQVRSFASRLSAMYRQVYANSTDTVVADINDYFAVDMHEEGAAFSGALLWRQAWFANEALSCILSRYAPGTKAILVGHSMGGVVARAMWSLGNFPRTEDGKGRVHMVATLGTPHRAPVVVVDEYTKRLYRAINEKHTTTGASDADQFISSAPFAHLAPLLNGSSSTLVDKPFILSIAGGERDFQIEPALTELGHGLYASSHALSFTSHTMKYAPFRESGLHGPQSTGWSLHSVDHPCMAWCRAIVETVAFSIRRVTEELMESNFTTTTVDMEYQKQLFLPHALEDLREIASTPLSTSSKKSSTAPQTFQLFEDAYFASFVSSAAVAAATPVDVNSTVPTPVLAPTPVVSSAFDPSGAQGLYVVYAGLMTSIKACPVGVKEGVQCTELFSHAHQLAPLSHPWHDHMDQTEKLALNFTLGSTYSLHLNQQEVQQLVQTSGKNQIQFHFTPHSATVRYFSTKMAKLDSGKKRLMAYGFAYTNIEERSDLPTTLPNTPSITRVIQSLPAGIEKHADFNVHVPHSENEYALPALVALVSTAEGDAEGVQFNPVDFSDQIFAFFPNSSLANPQTRGIRLYRSGVQRKLVTLLIRIPILEGEQQNDYASNILTLDVYEHSFLSFIHILYLQFPILPQILLGVSLLLFGVQHEYLRKHGRFPRVYELFYAPSIFRPVTFFGSSLVWGLIMLVVGCQVFFHGSLAGDALDLTKGATAAGENISITSGWSLSHSSWELGAVGVVLVLACAMLHVLVEFLLYVVLRTVNTVLRIVWKILSFPFSGLSIRTLPTSESGPVKKYWSFVVRKVLLILWIVAFLIALVFTSLMSLFALKYFTSIALQDSLYFLLQQFVAWVSTMAFAAGLITEHVYLEKTILAFLVKNATIAHVALPLLVLGLVILALLIQCFTFPNLWSFRNPVIQGGDSSKKRSLQSAAAYKTSCLTIMLLLVAILLLPGLLASFRLDATKIEGAWAKHAANGNKFLFQPPGSPKQYDATITVPLTSVKPDGSITTAPPSIFLFPFVVQSTYDPLSVIALVFVTLVTWCMFHAPFSPPILQSACITTYGIALIFVHGPIVSFLNFWWVVLILAACMWPKALSSGVYIANLIHDFALGQEGSYEEMFEQETEKYQQGKEGKKPAESKKQQ